MRALYLVVGALFVIAMVAPAMALDIQSIVNTYENLSIILPFYTGAITASNATFDNLLVRNLTTINQSTINVTGDIRLTGNITFTGGWAMQNSTRGLLFWNNSGNVAANISNRGDISTLGNINTTGTLTAGTVNSGGTGTFNIVKSSGTIGLGMKDPGSSYYTYIKYYYGTPYNSADRTLSIHLGDADRILSIRGTVASIDQDVTSSFGTPKFISVKANQSNFTSLSTNYINFSSTNYPINQTNSTYAAKNATGWLNEYAYNGSISTIANLSASRVNIGGSGAFPLYITGTADPYGRMVEITKTNYDLSGANTQEAFEIQARASTGGSRTMYGLIFDTRYTGTQAQTGSISGIYGQVYHTGTGSVTTSSGLSARLYLDQDNPTVANYFYGMWTGGYIANTKTGQVTTYVGVRDDGMDAEDGTVTYAYNFQGGAHVKDAGTLNNAFGIYLAPQVNGDTRNFGLVLGGDSDVSNRLTSGAAAVFGAGYDAAIGYDGTDLVVNPKLVGTGAMKVLGNLNVTGNTTLTGTNMTLTMPNLKKIDGTTACSNGDALKWEQYTGRIYCG